MFSLYEFCIHEERFAFFFNSQKNSFYFNIKIFLFIYLIIVHVLTKYI